MLKEFVFTASGDSSKEDFSGNEWWLLPGTGFDVRKQVNKLRKEGDSAKWLKQTKEDINGFWLEYLARLPALPIDIKFEEVDGARKIVGSRYAGQLWVNTASDQERDGVVRASVEKIEETLLAVAPGSVVVMTSPPGWSGYPGILYPDTQTYVFKIDEEGKLDAITIVSDMDLLQNKKLLEIFEIYTGGSTEKEQIKQIINGIVLLNGKEKTYVFEDVLSEIENVLGKPQIRDKSTFADARRLIAQRKETGHFIEEGNGFVAQKIKEFEARILLSSSFAEIEFELGKTILEISDYSKTKQTEGTRTSGRINYNQVLSDLQKVGGCNGGGKHGELKVVPTPFGPRLVVVTEILCCTCPNPKCKKQVEALVYGGKIHCPECGAEAIWI